MTEYNLQPEQFMCNEAFYVAAADYTSIALRMCDNKGIINCGDLGSDKREAVAQVLAKNPYKRVAVLTEKQLLENSYDPKDITQVLVIQDYDVQRLQVNPGEEITDSAWEREEIIQQAIRALAHSNSNLEIIVLANGRPGDKYQSPDLPFYNGPFDMGTVLSLGATDDRQPELIKEKREKGPDRRTHVWKPKERLVVDGYRGHFEDI